MTALKIGAAIFMAYAMGFAAGFDGGFRAGESRAYGTVTELQVQRTGKSSLQPNLEAGRKPATPPGS